MKRAVVTIEGVSPLLMNPMNEETLMGILTGTSVKVPRDLTPVQICERKLYKGENGELGIPAVNLFSSLAEAGRKVKNGKTQISTATSTTLPSFLEIEELFLPFSAEAGWVPDLRRGVSNSGANKVAVAIVRPRFDLWELKITIGIDDTVVDESVVRELFRIAGTSVGLCDFRPAKKGQFGRFTVSDWKSLD